MILLLMAAKYRADLESPKRNYKRFFKYFHENKRKEVLKSPCDESAI